jgi:hypothetical protein
MRLLPSLTVLAALSGGCVVGQKIAYQDGTPHFLARAPIVLALDVQDRRDEVSRGEKKPTYVGVFRGGFGNPFDVSTASGAPLAVDFRSVIGRGLAARGYRVTSAPVATPAASADALASLAKTGAPRALLVQLVVWNSDTYNGTTLTYDVRARVLELPSGRQLATARLARERDLGASFFDPGGNAKEAVPRACRAILEELLNAAAMVEALGPAPPPPAEAGPAAGGA